MKKLPFTIIHKNNNVDFFFNLHEETKDPDLIGKFLRISLIVSTSL